MVRIVAIDDDICDLQIIKRSLRRYDDLSIVAFTDIEQAIVDLQETPADLVLLDLCLPKFEDFDGFQLVHQTSPDTPIIVLTGCEEITVYSQAIQAGAHDCVCKNDVDGAMLYRVIRNSLQRHKLQIQLREAASKDSLTGLPNRAALMKTLERRLAEAHPRAPFCLLFIDIDDFKLINDGHGHEVGDFFLVELVHRIKKCLGPADMLARFGGDEFVVLLSGASSDTEVSDFETRVYEQLSRPINIDGNELYSAFSMGAVALNERHQHYNELLLQADTAMFAAKSQGKSRYVWFDEQMQREALERLSFERALHKAVERDEFKLLYQPVVDIGSGQVVGFEALLRWEHDGQTISPLKFIPVAERTGVIHRIGQWVLETATAQLASWAELRPDVSIAINISPIQLDQNGYAQDVISTVQAAKIAPHLLTIEVTESGAIRDFDNAVRVLTALREIGMRVSVDDFGTGHSSLSHLHRLPVTEVKIDRSFVQTMDDASDYSRLFVETIKVLASSIGLETVAEGIETQRQRDMLLECGYSRGQGFLFSRPIPAEEATELLRKSVRGEELWAELPAIAGV
jgi:diguanylate cyclase (GGDEF)-like protein